VPGWQSFVTAKQMTLDDQQMTVPLPMTGFENRASYVAFVARAPPSVGSDLARQFYRAVEQLCHIDSA